MKRFLSTSQAAERLGVPPDRLRYVVARGYIRQPRRAPWGFFIWFPEDLRRAGKAVAQVRRYHRRDER